MDSQQHNKNQRSESRGGENNFSGSKRLFLLLTLIISLFFNQLAFAEETLVASDKVKLHAVLTPPYIIGPGDQLIVVDRTLRDVFGQVEQYNLTVSADGYISVPLPDGTQENILSAGYTLDELSSTIREAFSQTLKNPLLFVQILRYRPINVYIAGEVVKPGVYKIESTTTSEKGGSTTSSINTFGLTLTEAIQLAGGLKPRANVKLITVTRGSNFEKLTIDLKALLEGESDIQDISLQPGDSIYVSTTEDPLDQAQNYISLLGKLVYQEVPVSVVGEVKNGGNYILPNDATLLDAIGKAGGIDKVGSLKKVRLSRYDENGVFKTLNINLHDSIFKGVPFSKIALKPNDVIELEASKGKEVRSFLRDSGVNTLSIIFGTVAGGFSGFLVQDSLLNRIIRGSKSGLPNLPGSGNGITIIGGSGGGK